MYVKLLEQYLIQTKCYSYLKKKKKYKFLSFSSNLVSQNLQISPDDCGMQQLWEPWIGNSHLIILFKISLNGSGTERGDSSMDLDWWFSTGAVFLPKTHLSIPGEIFGRHNWKKVATDMWSRSQRTAPATKNYQAQSVNRAELRNPDLTSASQVFMCIKITWGSHVKVHILTQ